ncbi:desulfoferrodoxin [Candidatus Woesearchaeota archaeon]|nr:desulfoferrodoxin [Candidatus Woesearchaeota archaeon]MBT4368908.1 desulfoferrodoxin [Candidatus Woesearchaeota archaeon]MBT4712197.1 desulfoferrodoxin [Candidatus Woesearchaeota archaeon]MBT6639055.1 desulfoferrodoxin [Candidatus Woesearchaeota archaeon]MBT7134255.1 desulfoferrodoxin [Candidatus Woesearchaeota archaeon]
MAVKNELYKCEICGNVVSIVEAGPGELVCCGQEMNILTAKTEDEGKEKHVPVLSVEGDKVVVNVGSIPHPMDETHFIELVQLFDGDELVGEKKIFPGEQPRIEFAANVSNEFKVRALCNVHGLWTS